MCVEQGKCRATLNEPRYIFRALFFRLATSTAKGVNLRGRAYAMRAHGACHVQSSEPACMRPCCMLYARGRIKYVRVSMWFRQARIPPSTALTPASPMLLPGPHAPCSPPSRLPLPCCYQACMPPAHRPHACPSLAAATPSSPPSRLRPHTRSPFRSAPDEPTGASCLYPLHKC